MHFIPSLVALSAVFVVNAQNENSSSNLPSLTEALSSNEDLSTLSMLLIEQYPGVLQSLNNRTGFAVLAPNNAALEALVADPPPDEELENLLRDHILRLPLNSSDFTSGLVLLSPTEYRVGEVTAVADGSLQLVGMVGNSEGDVQAVGGLGQRVNVTEADIEFSDGVIHIIDEVLTLPVSLEQALLAANLTALAGAIDTAGLGEAADRLEAVTLFAPNNAAFEAIASVLEDIPAEDLARTLQFHISGAGLPTGSAGIASYAGTELDSIVSSLVDSEGQTAPGLTFIEEGDDLFVNNARILGADIPFIGGVLHIIDAVMNPDNSTEAPDADSDTPTLAFEGAEEGELPFTTGLPSATATVTVPTAALGGIASNPDDSTDQDPTDEETDGTAADESSASLLSTPVFTALFLGSALVVVATL